VRTTIGYGSPNKANTSEVHGTALGAEEVKLTKKALGLDPDKSFHVPEDAAEHMRSAIERGIKAEADWQRRFEAWASQNRELASEWRAMQAGELPDGWEEALPTFAPGEEIATRKSGNKVINAIASRIPCFVGGDADLSVSTLTYLAGQGDVDGQSGAGRNIRYGVREHAMGGTANGIAYHGGVRTFTATFFTFSDYMRAPMRLAAMNKLPVVFVFTHDSIGLGEDGPTHQPVEHLASLRAMPGLWVVRPADANEVTEAWKLAMQRKTGPTCIVLTRQNVPTLDRTRYAPASGLRRGAYVLSDASGGPPEAIVMATGSEVNVALKAQDELAKDGIRVRVVDMPCWEAFEAQDSGYRASVLPENVTARVAIEAGASFGWSRYVGSQGACIALDRYGGSAPGGVCMKELGFTPDNVAKKVRALLGR
jgi:transketolase